LKFWLANETLHYLVGRESLPANEISGFRTPAYKLSPTGKGKSNLAVQFTCPPLRFDRRIAHETQCRMKGGLKNVKKNNKD